MPDDLGFPTLREISKKRVSESSTWWGFLVVFVGSVLAYTLGWLEGYFLGFIIGGSVIGILATLWSIDLLGPYSQHRREDHD